jgi:cell division protein FtsX
MKKLVQNSVLILLFITVSSFAVHKFYVSIYQINYVPQKKMIQITSRIFVDDMNDALEKKFHKKTYVGTDRETEEDVVLMKKYLAEKFILKLNGVAKPMNFLSKEIEVNVIVSYFSIKEVSKITSLSIENSALLEVNEEQQNIIQANISGEKQSLLLTVDNYKGMLK